MKTSAPHSTEPEIPQDFRMTPQRREVYDVLMASCDHPTATDVFLRAKNRMPGISLATVYNCLDTLAERGLIRQVNLERESSRYCANLNDHVHFHCESCGSVVDAVPVDDVIAKNLWRLPSGSRVTRLDVAIRGLCPACTQKQENASRS